MSKDFIAVPGGALAKRKPPLVTRRDEEQTTTDWALIAQQLRDDPNEWYLLAIGPHAAEQHRKIRPGDTVNWRPAGEFESCISQEGDGSEIELYGRYVGPAGRARYRGGKQNAPAPSGDRDAGRIKWGGVRDIAALCGVSRQRVYAIAKLDGFPRPRLGSSPALWDMSKVQLFVDGWDRQTGRHRSGQRSQPVG